MKALALFALFAASLFAQGWAELANTALRVSDAASVCPPNHFNAGVDGMPDYLFRDNCRNVIDAWSGAVADTKRNRLLLFGGGHVAYHGNEVYSLDMQSISPGAKAESNAGVPALRRLTDPSVYQDDCSANADGTPYSVHTYGGLVYLPKADKMFKWLGANYCATAGDANIYLFNLATNTWEKPTVTWPGGTPPAAGGDGAYCALDTTTDNESVICFLSYREMWRYDVATSTATILGAYPYDIQSQPSVVLDPDRKVLYAFGYATNTTPNAGKIYAIDLTDPSYTKTDITSQTTGCDDLIAYAYPSVTWDPSINRVVGYVPRVAGSATASNTVVVFDSATKTCVTQPVPGGPDASAAIRGASSSIQGMFGRFAYFPALHKYVLVNNAALNAYTLELHKTPTNGLGASTVTCLDRDGDGYGVGCAAGPDADDLDADVHTAAQVLDAAKWGSMAGYLAHLGYAPAKIWLLATDGNNATGASCTPATFASCTPYLNWAGISALMASGDMVMLRGGTYTFWAIGLPSGTAGHPTIIMSYPGEQAYFTPYPAGFDLIGKSWVVMDGLKFYANGSNAGINFGNGQNIVIRNVDSSGNEWGIVAGADTRPLLDITIENSVLHDNPDQHGIYLTSHAGILSRDVFVRRNLLHDNDYTGFQYNGKVNNLVVEQNISSNNWLAGFSWLNGVSKSYHLNNVSINDGQGGLVISTYDGNEGAPLCGSGGETCTCSPANYAAICAFDQTNNLIQNFTVYLTGKRRDGLGACNGSSDAACIPAIQVGRSSNCTTALCLGSDNGSNTFRNIVLAVNNANDHYPPMLFPNGAANTFLSTSSFEKVVYANAGGTSVIGYGANASYGYEPKSCAQAAALAASFTGCTNADPKFVAANPAWYATPASFDLRLQATSPAATGGSTTRLPLFDLTGSMRSFAAPSLGAYQFTGTATTLRIQGAVKITGAVR